MESEPEPMHISVSEYFFGGLLSPNKISETDLLSKFRAVISPS